jgi:hypothetical protein
LEKILEFISAEPFDDYAIKDFINTNGIEEICDWTEKEAVCISMEGLGEFIDKCILTEYDEPYEMGAGYDSEENYYENRFPGLMVQPTEELLHDLFTETPFEITDSIAKYLSNEYWTSKNLYSPSTGEILYRSWEEFTNLIKHKVRFMFFSKHLKRKKPTYEDYTDPYSILDEIDDAIKKHKLITTFEPDTLHVFRARQHSPDRKIVDVKELGSPPDTIAHANRLSPAGIPMFYGAFDSTTAITEIIDFGKVNDIVSVGKFSNIQKLNLIDFSKLKWISIFDEDNRHLRESFVLLRKFVSDLSSPISNDGSQHIDYVPTQVVTEYLKNSFSIVDLGEIHGLIYPSSKRNEKNCIVLFFTQEHLTENHSDKKIFLSLDLTKIKQYPVKDVTVTISFDRKLKI